MSDINALTATMGLAAVRQQRDSQRPHPAALPILGVHLVGPGRFQNRPRYGFMLTMDSDDRSRGGPVTAVPADELFTVAAGLPDLAGVPLIEMLDGFIDAGMARRLTREHLFATCESTPVATFDVDLLHDYRARRPPMVFAADHWESYEAPTLDVQLLRDGAGRPFLA